MSVELSDHVLEFVRSGMNESVTKSTHEYGEGRTRRVTGLPNGEVERTAPRSVRQYNRRRQQVEGRELEARPFWHCGGLAGARTRVC